MMYADLDHEDGYHIYESMLRLRPDFLVPTGDTVMGTEAPYSSSAARDRPSAVGSAPTA